MSLEPILEFPPAPDRIGLVNKRKDYEARPLIKKDETKGVYEFLSHLIFRYGVQYPDGTYERISEEIIISTKSL